MSYFEVEGGYPLAGSITPQGAKNEALQVLCASLLTDQPITYYNVPDIQDVRMLLKLLEGLGVTITKHDEHTYTLTAKNIDLGYLHSEEAREKVRRIRGSVLIMGPLLARFHEVYLPRPGGDKIGRRRLDTHFLGFEALGAKVSYHAKEQGFYLKAPEGLKGTYILLDEASVTGTANLLMASVLAPGETILYHAACEPYIQQLCRLLIKMGAKIEGIGSNLLKIQGVKQLKGAEHHLLPDMIEVGSFIAMAAMTLSQIRIVNAGVKHLGQIPRVFKRLGVELFIEGDDIVVNGRTPCKIATDIDGAIMTISDHPWPGFPPDLLSIALVLATQCEGQVLIHQKMFESRLFFVDKLIEMGAKVILCDPHRALVIGLGRRQPLRGITMSSPDIRAGIALLMAAMSAEGISKIYGVEQIDRGYERIDQRLNALGAKIQRIPS